MRAQESVNTGSDFGRGLLQQESRLREHLDFAGQTNRSLKEGIEAARRKLNNSASTGLIRGQQDPRNFVAVQGRPSRDHFSTTQTPQYNNTHSLLVRKGAPEVPEETDEEVGQLRKEVVVLRRENDGLRQVVAQNDASARFAIGQLQGALDAARADGERTRGENERSRAENEKIRNALEHAIKQNNDARAQLPQGKQDTSSCIKCPRLQGKIRELQLQLSELTLKLSDSARQLQVQASRRNEITLSSESFREEMNLRLKNMEGWLRTRNQEIMALEQKNLELSRRMTERERQLNQQLTTLTEEYYSVTEGKQRAELQSRRVNAELEGLERQLRESEKQSREAIGKLSYLSSKIDALNGELWQGEREKSDVVVAVGELEEKMGEVRYRLQEREAESKQLEGRLQERDSNLKRLGEEYSSSLERAEQLEELTNQLRQRNEDLQSELDRLRSAQYPPSFNPNQLLAKINSIHEELEAEQENARLMQERLIERENTVAYLQTRLQEATVSYETVMRQAQSQTLQLTETIEALTEQNHTIAGQYSELHASSIQKQEQAASEREELVRRLQRSESALERLNKQPLQTGEERRIIELQDLVSALRQEQGHYESVIERTQNEQQQIQQDAFHLQEELARLSKERNELVEQVRRLKQKMWERENSNDGQQTFVQSLKREVTALEQQNDVLKQENIIVRKDNFALEQQRNILLMEKNAVEQENGTIQKENITLRKEYASKKDQTGLEDNSKAIQSQDASLKREITVLEQENTAIKQRLATFQQQITSLQTQNIHLIQQSRILNEENTNLKKEIKDLSFERQLQFSNLEKAENYIATLIEQISTQSNIPNPTRTRDEAVLNQNRILANQRQALFQQNQTLRIRIDQLSKQRNQPTQSPIKEREQRDPTSTIEFANLQVKNQELNAHLSSAERFINSLEQRVQELVESQQRVHNALMHEREAKGQVERTVLSKDALIEKQSREYSQEIANRDALIDTLQRRIAEVGRMQPIPSGQSSSSQREVLQAYQRISLLEDEVAALQRQRLQLEETKAQSDGLVAELDTKARRTAQQLFKLQHEKAEEHEHLVRAEAYITELLEQIRQSERQPDDVIVSKNQKEIKPAAAILTENQDLTRENQSLALNNNRLSSQNEALYKQTQALRKEIQSAHTQIQALKEKQQQQPSPSKPDPSPSQKDSTQTLQLQSLRSKNEELLNHLQNAEAFITTLQAEVQNLTRTQQDSASLLSQERQARMSLEQTLSLNEGQKDRTIYELRQELQKVNLSLNTLALSSQEGKVSKGEDDSDKRKITELQEAVDILKFQRSQQETVLHHTSIYNLQLADEINNLQSQITKNKQHVCPSLPKEEEPTDAVARQALRAAKYENQILAKQNRELAARLQEQRGKLERAEAYITEILGSLPKDQQISKASPIEAAENARLANELQKTLEQKRRLQLSLENQVRLKKELQLQVEQLNSFLLRAQNEFELNAREASEELRILKEMCGAPPSKQQEQTPQKVENKPEKTPAKVEAKPETKLPSPESLELAATKAKNDELYENLKSAEDFIAEQERKIQEFINNQLQLKKALSVEGEARSRLQGQNTIKDAEMQRVRLGLEQQLREKDKMIDELGANLREATEAVNAYAAQLRAIQEPSAKPEDGRIAQLEHLISTLRNEREKQEAVIATAQLQANALAAEKLSNRQVSEKIRQRLERENEALKKKVDVIELEKQTQIKNLENAEEYITSLLEQINRGVQVQGTNSQNQTILENQCQELQKEKDTLSAKNLSTTAQNKQLLTVNQAISNEKSTLAARVQALQGQNKALQQQVREEKSALVARVQSLQGQNKTLQQQIREGELKLQAQTDQTQQVKRDANDLAKQLADSKRESQKNAQELVTLKQSHQQLAKELQNRLQEDPQRQQKTEALTQETTIQTAELQTLRNQNRDLHGHLQSAQEFIMNLEKHLQGLGRAEEQLKMALAQEQKAKSQFESAISAKEAEVQRLNIEVSQSKTQLDPLKQKVNQLQSESVAAVQRAKLSETQLADTVKQLQELRAKLGEAEDYIINLQGEIRGLREFLARAEASIAALSDQNNKIKQQPNLPQQPQGEDLRKVIDALQQEVRQVTAQKQASAEQSKQRQNQLQSLVKELAGELEAIKQTPTKSQAKPVESKEDATFFKNRLIEAEDYIAQVERLHEANGNIMAQQSSQLNAQAQKISNLQGNLNKSAKKITDLTGQLLRAQQSAKKLQDTLRNQPTADDLSQLSGKVKNLEGKLVNCEKDRLILSQINDETLKKLQKSQESTAALSRGKTQIQDQIPVLKAKIQQAEEQVAALFSKNSATSQTIADLQASSRQDQTGPLLQENEALKRKLREAEQYILQDQKDVTEQSAKIRQLQQKKRELVDDNLQLMEKLQLKDMHPQEISTIETAEFFKDKLFQAEKYIHQMNQDYSKTVADVEAKQRQIDDSKEQARRLEIEIQRLNNEFVNEREETKRKLEEAQIRQKAANDDNQRKSSQLKDVHARFEELLHTLSTNDPETAKLNVNNAKADAEKLREKLVQAETYIQEMNQDYAKVVAEAEGKQGQIDALKEQGRRLENEVQKLENEAQRMREEAKRTVDEAQSRQKAANDDNQRKNALLNDANARIEQLLQIASTNKPEDKINEHEHLRILSSAKDDAQRLREKLIEAEAYVHELEESYSKVVAEAEAKQRQIDNLKNQVIKIEREVPRLESELLQTKAKLQQLQSRYQAANDDKANAQRQIQAQQGKIQSLQDETSILQKQMSENRDSMDAMVQKLIQFEKERNTANERANYSQALLMDTVKHLEELKAQPLADPAKEQAMNDHIHAVENEIRELEAANNNIKGHLEQSQEENKQLQERLKQAEILAKAADDGAAKLLQKLTEAESYIYELEGQNQRIKQVPMANTDEIDSLKAKLTEVEGLIDDGEQENKTLKEKLGEAEDFIRHQEDELKRLRENLDAVANIEDEEGRMKAELTEKEEENKTLKVQLAETDAYIALQDEELKRLLKKLAHTETQINDQENRLKAELSQAEQENKNLKEQLGEAETHINNQNEELKRLQGKLAQAEAHIEDEENRLRAKLTQAEHEIDNLEEQSTRLKARLASPSPQPHPKLDDSKQQIAALQEEIRRLNVEKDINEQRLQAKQSQIRTLSQALESLSNQPVAAPLKPQEIQEDATFFRNKLLEAERYIEEVEHINQTNAQVLSQQNEEVKQLTSRGAVLENALNQAEKDRNALAIQLASQRDNSRRLKEAAGKQISPGEIVALQNKVSDLQGKLNVSESEKAKQKQANEQLVIKSKQLQQQLSKLEKEKTDADAEGIFFKTKLFQAENYITQLQEASNNKEDITNKLKEIPLLQETLKELKTALQAQKSETEAKIAKVDALEKKLQEVQDESDFFRKKLLEAETYINHLEQTITEQQDPDSVKQRISQTDAAAKAWETKARSAQDKNKELSLMNEELLNHLNDRRPSEEIQRLQDSLVELRTALNESQATNKTLQSRLAGSPPPPQKQPSQEDFFKEKLLEAESYIRQLEDENRKLGDRVEEVAVAPPQEEYEELGRMLEESEEKNHVLAVEIDRLEHEIQQERDHNAELQEAVTGLKKDNAKLQDQLAQKKEERDAKVNELNALLQDTEKELNDVKQTLQETAVKKEEAEERAKKYEDLSNTLQETLTLLDNIPKHIEPSEQSQEKLREAEGKITDLTVKADQKEKEVALLKDQLSQLQRQKQEEEVHRKQEKDSREQEEVDQESTIFALEDERNALQEQVKHLENANKDIQGKLATIKDQLALNKQLLHDLQQEQQKGREQKEEQRLLQHEEQPRQDQGLAESIPIDENGNPVLPEYTKVASQIKPPSQQQSNSIEVQFLQQKLQQAEELILQQQNEISKLTDELVHLQNDSSTLKRQLSTHKREEEDMEEALRALSSSQQDLVERVEPLENANETLRDQIRQAKQTIAELKDQNAAVKKEFDALREKNASLEEKAKLPLEEVASPQKEAFKEERERALQTLRENNQQLQEDKKQLSENNKQLSENNKQLQDSNKELIENNKQLQQSNSALQEQNNALEQKNNSLNGKCNGLQEQNSSLEAKKAELQEQNAALKQSNTVLDDNNKLLSENASQLQQLNNQLIAKNQDLQQKTADLTNQNADLTKQNADLLQKNLALEEQLQSNPFEEQHEKFIELEAKVLQLQDAEQALETALSDSKHENNEIQQRAAEQATSAAKQLEDKQADIQHLQDKLNSAEAKADKIEAEKDVLQKRLEDQLNESGKLTLEREVALTKEVDELTEKLVGEVMKAREFERDLAAKDETNAELQTALEEANESFEEMQRTIDNLTRAHDRTVIPLQERLSAAQEEVTKLKTVLNEKEQKIQQLVPQAEAKDALERENNELKQNLSQKEREAQKKLLDKDRQAQELMGKLAEAEDYITELEQNKADAEGALSKVLANVQSIRQESDSLADTLRVTNAEKEKLLAQIKALQEEAEMAQSDNERLNSKVSYLNSMLDVKDQEIANLSELSRDREAELETLKQGLPQGNILPDSYREEENPNSSDPNEQIRQLNAELERKDEENRQLKVQRVNLQGEVAELQELLKGQDTDEDLKQHLVEADRTNIELLQQNEQLSQEVEALARDKAYLQCELTQLKNKPQEAPLSPREVDPLQKVQAVSVSAPNPSSEDANALREQIEQLHAQLEQERARLEEMLVFSVENDSLKHIKEDLEQKLHQAEAERTRLLNKLKEAEQALAAIPNQQEEEIARKDEELARKEQQLAQAQEKINKLQAQSQADRRKQALEQNLKKMLDLSNLQQDIDQQLTQQLQNFPYLHEFINSLLYRLRLASALELQKSLKIKQLTDQLQAAQREASEARDLRAGNDFLRGEVRRLEEERTAKENDQQAKYDEALEELLHYSGLNKDLETKLAEISELAEDQDKRIKGYEQQLDTSQPSQADNDLSQENYELRRKLESSERQLQRLRGDSSSLSSKEVFYMQFLKTCLDKVVDLEREVQQVEHTIEQTAYQGTHRSQPAFSQPEDTLQDRLQELEDKLVRNSQNIREHQQRSDGELFDLLRDLTELKELPEASRARIDDYLSQLQAQILQEHDQHNAEVSRLRDQVATLQHSARSNEDSPRGTREELLREITHLNNAIEIYYQESMRRKRNYRRTIEALLADVERIAGLQGEGQGEGVLSATEDMGRRLRSALQNDEEEDARQMELGDDFIISGNQMQILDNRQKTPLPAIDENPREEWGVQTDDDPKPFLAFLLSNPDLEKEDLKLLKRKVAELRGREVEESLQALRGQERRLEEVLQLGSRQNPQQLDNILLTLANTYSRDEISQIFGSEDNDELLNKLNEALCLQESFYRGENSASLLQNILDRKNKYYEAPTKLSEEVYNHLVALLSTKKDDEFYEEIQALFRDLFQTEVGFEQALKKKDELYRFHNERMNQIFNRSSSEGSEEYMNVFEGQPPQEGELEMHSERKPRRSEPEHDSGSER